MIYDITKPTAPALPTLGKGTECIKLLLSQASKDMQEPLVPMFFPILGAHVSGAEFQYPDHTWKELCGIMANLVAESGGNKGQLSIQRVNKSTSQQVNKSTSQQVPPAELFIFFIKRSVLNSKFPFHYVKNLIHYVKKIFQAFMNNSSEYFTLYPCAGRTRTWQPSCTSSAPCQIGRTSPLSRLRPLGS